MKLPTYENDHYVLDDGEACYLEYPDTYWIPDLKERESLKVDDIVQLVFRMEETKGSDDISVERMWVQITGKQQEFYSGFLANKPGGSDCVVPGQTVYFNACHVIDIYEESE